jgi:predicted membrane chloride channel (bestrophin family)
MVDRESYSAWRAQCPLELLSPLSQVAKWLGDLPTIKTSLPEPVAPVAPTALPEKNSREIALVEAENAALFALRKILRREPDFEEFWDYLTTQDSTGTVADNTDDRLMWVGKDGRNCETAKATLRNRLTATKKRNPFTP